MYAIRSYYGIYSLVGNPQKVVEAYVQVVADYYDVDAWTDQAIQERNNFV